MTPRAWFVERDGNGRYAIWLGTPDDATPKCWAWQASDGSIRTDGHWPLPVDELMDAMKNLTTRTREATR